jgi:hypothetical protein
MKERLHYVASREAAEQLIEAFEMVEGQFEEYVIYIEGLSKVSLAEIDAEELVGLDEWPDTDIVVWHGSDADEQALMSVVSSVTPAPRLFEADITPLSMSKLSIEQMAELIPTIRPAQQHLT